MIEEETKARGSVPVHTGRNMTEFHAIMNKDLKANSMVK